MSNPTLSHDSANRNGAIRASVLQTASSEFMVNYRVDDLPALLAELEKAGVEIAGELVEEPNGKFAWIVDPEGRKIELWEPVDSDDDPYLE